MVILVTVGVDSSNEPAINPEEIDLEAKKCVISDEELPVEQCVNIVADTEDAMITSVTTEAENGDNTGKLFYQYIVLPQILKKWIGHGYAYHKSVLFCGGV